MISKTSLTSANHILTIKKVLFVHWRLNPFLQHRFWVKLKEEIIQRNHDGARFGKQGE